MYPPVDIHEHRMTADDREEVLAVLADDELYQEFVYRKSIYIYLYILTTQRLVVISSCTHRPLWNINEDSRTAPPLIFMSEKAFIYICIERRRLFIYL